MNRIDFSAGIHEPVKIIIFKILQPNARLFLTLIHPIISNICQGIRNKTYPEFTKVLAPLIEVGGWFLVQ